MHYWQPTQQLPVTSAILRKVADPEAEDSVASSKVIRASRLWAAPAVASAAFVLLFAFAPNDSSLSRYTGAFFFGFFGLWMAMACFDHISFEGDAPVVTTRRWLFIPHKFEVHAIGFGTRVTVIVPWGLKVVYFGSRKVTLWPYAGRQQKVIDRLLSSTVKLSPATNRPASTGRRHTRPDRSADVAGQQD